jgi:hypothetical protein
MDITIVCNTMSRRELFKRQLGPELPLEAMLILHYSYADSSDFQVRLLTATVRSLIPISTCRHVTFLHSGHPNGLPCVRLQCRRQTKVFIWSSSASQLLGLLGLYLREFRIILSNSSTFSGSQPSWLMLGRPTELAHTHTLHSAVVAAALAFCESGMRRCSCRSSAWMSSGNSSKYSSITRAKSSSTSLGSRRSCAAPFSPCWTCIWLCTKSTTLAAVQEERRQPLRVRSSRLARCFLCSVLSTTLAVEQEEASACEDSIKQTGALPLVSNLCSHSSTTLAVEQEELSAQASNRVQFLFIKTL